METRRGNFPKWRMWLGLWLISVGARITEIGDVVFDGKRPIGKLESYEWKVRPDDRR